MNRSSQKAPRRRWLVSLLVFGVCVIGARSDDRTSVNDRTAQPDRTAQVAKQPLKDGPELRRELETFLTQFGKDMKAGNYAKIAQSWDINRQMEQMAADIGMPAPGPEDQKRFERSFALGKRGSTLPVFAWTRTDIRQVSFLDNGDVVVVARHFDAETSVTASLRWWMCHDGKRWRVYDQQDLNTGLRVSDLAVTAMVQLLAGEPPKWLRALPTLGQAANALVRNDLDTAERLLQIVAKVEFPRKIEAIRWLAHGNLALRRGHFEEALTLLDRAEKFNRDIPAVDHLRAVALNRLGRHEEALANVKKYTDLLGEHNESCYELGCALAGLNRRQEAADAFRRSLKLDPEYADSIDGLRTVLPNHEKHEVARYFLKLQSPEAVYRNLADFAADDGDGVGLEVLASAMRKRLPKAANVIYDQARAKGMQGKYKEALPLYKLALERQTESQLRKQYLRQMLVTAVDAGMAVEGYRSAADAKEAFAILAADLHGLFDPVALRQLLDVHRRQHPDDPLLSYYEAELAIDQHRYDDAAKLFAQLDPKKLDNDFRQRALHSRVFALFQAGKGMEAYEKIPSPKEVFSQLAALYAGKKDTARLKTLIARHRKAHPDDPNLPPWEVEAHWIAGDHAAVVKAITAQRELLADRRHAYRMRDWHIRSLYALKRDAEIEKEIGWILENKTGLEWNDLRGIFVKLRAEKKVRQAAHFADACRRAAPAHPEATLLAARGKVHEGKVKEAIELFRFACEQQPNEHIHSLYQSDLLFDMLDAGHVLAGYRAAPHRRQAFQYLAGNLLSRKKHDDLRALLKEHRAAHAADPWLKFYDGELALLKKEYREAEKLFVEAMRQVANRYERDRFAERLLAARYHLKGAAAAYEEAGPSLLHFSELARLCQEPPAPQQLRQLLDAHRKHFPNDPALPAWEVEIPWLAKDYPAVIAMLRSRDPAVPVGRQNEVLFRDRLVRSLSRLGKHDEAKKEIETLKRSGRHDLILEAAVHAVAGDVKATATALEQAREQSYSPFQFYLDPDLGPLLRSDDRFRALRERYPETNDATPPLEPDDR